MLLWRARQSEPNQAAFSCSGQPWDGSEVSPKTLQPANVL